MAEFQIYKCSLPLSVGVSNSITTAVAGSTRLGQTVPHMFNTLQYKANEYSLSSDIYRGLPIVIQSDPATI